MPYHIPGAGTYTASHRCVSCTIGGHHYSMSLILVFKQFTHGPFRVADTSKRLEREVASRISPIETVGLKERHENKELDSEQ